MDLWVHLVWNSLWFLDLDVCSFTRIGRFSAIISWNSVSVSFSFSSPSGTLTMWMLILWMLSQRLIKLSSSFFILFSSCCSSLVISTTLSYRLLLCSPFSRMLLIPSSVFFISLIVFFSLILFLEFFSLLKFCVHPFFSWVWWAYDYYFDLFKW